jgi:hypothetical protein
MDKYETIELKDNHRLHIYYDEIIESPRDWDNLGTMLCVHRRYYLGDKQLSSHLSCLQCMSDDLGVGDIIEDMDLLDEVYQDEDRLQEWLNLRDNWVCLPLYLYDHGGITMNTGGFSCSWDSGQVGYIYASTKAIEAEFGEINDEVLIKVKNILESEVETYDQYLTGEVFGFRLMKISECDLGHEHEEEIDSCWGFYGSDWKTNGILDHIDSALIPENQANALEKVNVMRE